MNERKEKNKGGRPLVFQSVKELDDKIEAYWEYCDNSVVRTIKNSKGEVVAEITRPYTVTGLAAFLGTNRQTLLNYEKEGREEFFDSIKGAKAKIEASYEEKAMTGEGNAVMSIFTLKNNYNWRDKTKEESDEDNAPVVNINVNADLKDIPEDRLQQAIFQKI